MNPYIYGHLTFDKGTKAIGWRKDKFLANCAGTIRYPYDPHSEDDFKSLLHTIHKKLTQNRSET